MSDAFLERVEARVRAAEPRLRSEGIGHYALVHRVEQADLLRATAPVSFRPDGRAFVLGVGDTAEPHGGGILTLLFGHWRPEGRPATGADAFFFRPNRQALPLGALYEGHKRQLLLPGAPSLPRIRFFAEEPAIPDVERDAFALLRLLVAREADFGSTWVNSQGESLSVDRLLGSAWDRYLAHRDAAALEREDHSWLHLIDVLLAYRREGVARGSPGGQLDVDAVRTRFLEVELARREADDEALAHYAESLGLLVAEPALCWDDGARARIRHWLGGLEQRLRDLERADPGELTHLLRGLRALRLHASGLTRECRRAAGAP